MWARFAIMLAAMASLCICALAEDGIEEEDSAESWRERGHDLFLSWSMEEALLAYEESLRIDPENAAAWLDKAIIHEILARQAHLKAVALFDEILAENPKDARGWWGRGVAQYGLEQPEEARGSWERALEIYNETLRSDPEDGEAWFEKAEILISLGRNGEAIDAYERAIELNSTRADAAERTIANLLMQTGGLRDDLRISSSNSTRLRN
jgi:tetratricopeptide (TPR) repeat protein